MPEAVRIFARGDFVLVMDDFDRENECDLIVLGETLTPAQMAFMIKHSTGIVCVVADKPRLEKFGLYPAARGNTDKNATAFYVATDYLPTTSTGVSARDRCETVRAFCREESKADDFSKPGHMFPLCPRPGGVQERGGHTESAYDLCRLAGKQTVAAIGELMREDGEMMRLDECLAFGKEHGIPLISVDELRQWTAVNGATPLGSLEPPTAAWRGDITDMERLCSPGNSTNPTAGPEPSPTDGDDDWRSEMYACSTCTIPVRISNFDEGMRIQMFDMNDPGPIQVVACIKGKVEGKYNVPVRIHSECFTGDVLRSAKCDCGLQLEKFFHVMEKEQKAVLLYIRGHEGRGIGLAAKLEAYRLQTEEGLDTVDSNLRLGFPAEARSYKGICEVIRKLGIQSVRLFTNNPEKIAAVKQVVAVEHAPCQTVPLKGNIGYLKTKESRMEHMATMERTTMENLESNSNSMPWRRQASRSERGSLPELPEADSELEPAEGSVEPIEWPRFGNYSGFSIVVVATAWNKECSAQLVQGCEAVLLEAKCAVTLVEVPGALDLVAGCSAAMKQDSPPHAVVALGTFVRGETATSEVQFQATVSALQALNVANQVPVICGVVFCNSQEDALKKSSPTCGGQWAKNALQMISVCST